MSPQIRKIVWIIFLLSSSVSGFVALYSSNVYYDLHRAMRLINVSDRGFSLTFSDGKAWTETNITIENPSKQSFKLEYLDQKLYLNSLDSDGYIFVGHISNPIILEPFSSSNLTIKIIIPNYKILKIINSDKRNWLAVFYLYLDTPLFGDFRINFYREL
jgi:hypothetical protein